MSERFPPLVRHRGLQPLSREHFNGLRQARSLSRAADPGADPQKRRQAVRDFCAAWTAEIQDHFADEERLLIPLLKDHADVRRLLEEHRVLRALAAEAMAAHESVDHEPEWLRRLGTLLHDHIRWEERQLFPRVQESASESDLAALEAAADRIEAHRPGSRRRGEQRG